jgi:hypothetical protein
VLDNSILSSIGKLSRVKRITKLCSGIHKYRRFSKKNKTFRTDVYFCADCGNRVKLDAIFGTKTRCWGCNNVFNFNFVSLPIFPLCDNCDKSKMKEKRTVEKEEEISGEEVLANMMKELGLVD